MKTPFFILLTLINILPSLAWGPTGHRVIGLIAERHLSKNAKKNIEQVLRTETLAEVSTYMDFIRADKKYDHMSPWHYATIPDGKKYEELDPLPQGDILVTIPRLIRELNTKHFTEEDEAFALKCLIHLVGDIHQPLHIGNGQDRGGNDVNVEFFRQASNLHRVWDSELIDEQKYSYTEYADWINHATPEQVSQWQSDPLMVWAYESMSHREQAYRLPESKKLAYPYIYSNIHLVNLRLLQAGIRLAGILNELYG